MDRGAGGKFYRWAKGAQIRGNLDLLEGWAADVGLQEEAADYLRKLSSAADVLATPKVQLLQVRASELYMYWNDRFGLRDKRVTCKWLEETAHVGQVWSAL